MSPRFPGGLTQASAFTLITLCCLILGAAPPTEPPPPVAPVAPAPEPVRSDVAYPQELMQNVQNGTGLTAGEFEAYYAILAFAKRTPLDKQRAAAAERFKRREVAFKALPKNKRYKFSQFQDVFEHRDDWRGELVTIRGYIRDLKEFEPEGNTQGLKKLHQCFLWTKDSAGNPYAVVVSGIPANMPKVRNKETLDNVTVTGYMFKVWKYQADTEQGKWVAPLILASKLEWVPPAEKPPLLTSTQTAILILGLVAVGFGGWWYSGVHSAKIRTARREQQFEPLANDPLS